MATYRVIHDFVDKVDGKEYKAGDEYKGKIADVLSVHTAFRPALVVKEADKPKPKPKKDEE